MTSKIIGMIIRPMETFRAVEKEGYRKTLSVLAATLILQLLTSAILNISRIGEFYAIFLNWLSGDAMLFIMSGLFFVFVMILRKNTRLEEYGRVLRVIAYSNIIFAMFGWIPYFSFLATIWFMVLLIMGLRLYYGMNYKRSALAILAPYIIVIVLAYI